MTFFDGPLKVLMGIGRAVYESTNKAIFADFFPGEKSAGAPGAFCPGDLHEDQQGSMCDSISPKNLRRLFGKMGVE